MDLTAQIHDLAEHLDDGEKLLVVEIMKRFIPDNVATEDDLEDITQAEWEFTNGLTTSHHDIKWKF